MGLAVKCTCRSCGESYRIEGATPFTEHEQTYCPICRMAGKDQPPEPRPVVHLQPPGKTSRYVMTGFSILFAAVWTWHLIETGHDRGFAEGQAAGYESGEQNGYLRGAMDVERSYQKEAVRAGAAHWEGEQEEYFVWNNSTERRDRIRDVIDIDRQKAKAERPPAEK